MSPPDIVPEYADTRAELMADPNEMVAEVESFIQLLRDYHAERLAQLMEHNILFRAKALAAAHDGCNPTHIAYCHECDTYQQGRFVYPNGGICNVCARKSRRPLR